MEEPAEPTDIEVRPYLVVLKLDGVRAEHAHLREDLNAYSTSRPMLVCVGTGVAVYFINSHLRPHQMRFEGHLLGRDSRLIVELGGAHAAEGFVMLELHEWLGNHLYRR
ncbi:hypothetical protein EA658_09970 [Pseudoxanthomonas winnipegensis]|uniref:Uncharacterized protein n=1 Tax=Pseudoxanthomonas winnipegensis TaxID=2480810 RepID=A0ABY1WCS3_9GAMM|nr:hypothetical protein [Pseudoxanthomonas winnipegensis]TAA12443.1 hypothetical protein EA659_03680 [Pseudoxanthomonas winnipegensis]TAA19192.1 hypothetical protein EA658_09970 [Pseudoxanthomonas winnipegensis]TAH70453.1 hypothetical protein EA657_17035 [Pseudoxanthomonas winnipegensis]